MPFTHLLLVLLVVAIWGFNFIFVKLCLTEMPPLLICALRFFLASFPAIFFIKPPAAPFKWVFLYGMVMFALQFSLMFLGINAGMTPGLASIIIQVQVFFAILFAAIFLKEFPNVWQIVGGLVSFSGIIVVGMHHDATATLAGLLFIIAGAASWGIGNLITKKMAHVNMMSLVVWGSFIAFIPLLVLSLIFEGKDRAIQSFHHVSWVGITSLLYVVYGSTWVGYGVWNWLVSRYHVSLVTPFMMLVPVFAMFASVVVLHETFQAWKLLAGLLVVTGLSVHFIAPRIQWRKKMSSVTDLN
jgi:O-acetylserine/cysteine efflux transporter